MNSNNNEDIHMHRTPIMFHFVYMCFVIASQHSNDRRASLIDNTGLQLPAYMVDHGYVRGGQHAIPSAQT